jgi:hypothetical protein
MTPVCLSTGLRNANSSASQRINNPSFHGGSPFSVSLAVQELRVRLRDSGTANARDKRQGRAETSIGAPKESPATASDFAYEQGSENAERLAHYEYTKYIPCEHFS